MTAKLLPLLALAATTAHAQYIPYPAASDEAAWPGRGVIRTFDWQDGIRKNYFDNRGRDEDAFVIVGDSLTEGFNILPQRVPLVRTANRGVGGDTSRGILFRFPADVLSLNPQGVMICAGANDLTAHGNPDDAVANIRDMIALFNAYEHRFNIILCTVPMSSQPDAPVRAGDREQLNAGIRALAAEIENAVLLDLEAALQNPDGSQNLDCYQADRLHLSQQGYEKWAALLAPLLANKPGHHTPKNPTKIDLSQFELVWNDEFDGDELDRTKWDTPHQDRHGSSRWHTRHVTVKDGTCRIAIKKSDDPVFRYDSACIRTSTGYEAKDSLFSFKYGYAETRCRLPRHARADYWAAFWLVSVHMQHGPGSDTRLGHEIDIFETIPFWNHGRVMHALHWGGYGEHHNADGLDSGEHRELLNGEFHTFGLYWDEHEYVFYINGLEVARTDMKGLGSDENGRIKSLGTSQSLQYIKLSVEAAAWSGPHWDWEKTMPEEDVFEIDYVRVYQKK